MKMKRYRDSRDVPIIERLSICLPGPGPGPGTEPANAIHSGDDGFIEKLSKYFPTTENNAAERLYELKAELRVADTETFWRRLMEGLTEICHAQYGFVAKRILVDDHDSAIEMPPSGEPGSCLLGVAFYYNDGKSNKAMHRDYKYLAWGAPCGYMKHDKVFLIPESMSSFITHNPNALPFAAEGYLGVPLFSQGKCFAHFGLMWTQAGLDSRDISWGYMEMVMHSLEDMIVNRLVTGQGFAKNMSQNTANEPKEVVIPKEAITATQSLKPYAKSLSHELRTPMQGVVGMLDVMHATVQEQLEGHSNSKIRNIFKILKDNIEVVQDSSQRAVEAADNVVHAYDMNMQIPDTPLNEHDSPATANSNSNYFDYKPSRLIEGSNISVNPFKRRRSSPNNWHFGNATKVRNTLSSPKLDVSPKSEIRNASHTRDVPRSNLKWNAGRSESNGKIEMADILNSPIESSVRNSVDVDAFPTPGIKNSNIREMIPIVINESLRVGGRPDSAISEPTDRGERIEVRTRSSNGYTTQKLIEWSVEEDVPEALYVDERDLAKLISAVFLNAVKFTEEGSINLTVRLSKSLKYILITMTDTGVGIPEDFRPELFKAFSREDDSLTRSKEGLGLGLLVAKGLARRLGGDISLVRSEIQGADRGSEFEIRVPLDAAETISRTATPLSRTPEPFRASVNHSSGPTPRSSTSYNVGPRVARASSPLRATSPTKENARTPTISKLLDGDFDSIRTTGRFGSILKSAGPKQHLYDRKLAEKHPLTFLVAEDNKLNRKLLVSMLGKFGYTDIYEAFDGNEAVRIMREIYQDDTRNDGRHHRRSRLSKKVDVILMDLWMPELDGYQATEQILAMFDHSHLYQNRNVCNGANGFDTAPTILAVSADVTDEAINRATRTGMEGFMTKPYKLMDLQRLILEFCVKHNDVPATTSTPGSVPFGPPSGRPIGLAV